jgi:dihydroorotase
LLEQLKQFVVDIATELYNLPADYSFVQLCQQSHFLHDTLDYLRHSFNLSKGLA